MWLEGCVKNCVCGWEGGCVCGWEDGWVYVCVREIDRQTDKQRETEIRRQRALPDAESINSISKTILFFHQQDYT